MKKVLRSDPEKIEREKIIVDSSYKFCLGSEGCNPKDWSEKMLLDFKLSNF